jgi:hypothetical protein
MKNMALEKIFEKMQEESMADDRDVKYAAMGVLYTFFIAQIDDRKNDLTSHPVWKQMKKVREFWKNVVTANCSECGIELAEMKIKFCGGCNFVAYCDREHQVGDWKSHSKECKRMKKLGQKLSKMKQILKRIEFGDDVFVEN